jgi:phage terminase large subunit-like protein
VARATTRNQADVQRYLVDRMAFRREQLILEDGRPFGAAVELWQEENIFGPLDERDTAGHPRYRLAYIETPRGQGKTTMAAAEALSELVLGGAGRRIYCFANDEDQAGLLHEAAAGFVRRNPLLGGALKVERRLVRSPRTGSYLRVMAADAASAHGLTPDLVVFDELHALHRRDLWDAVYTAIAKKHLSDTRFVTKPVSVRASTSREPLSHPSPFQGRGQGLPKPGRR